MLKFSPLRSLNAAVFLSEDHDRKLRRAFGRLAKDSYRPEGAKIVEAYYGQQGCFHCDCRPDAERPPLLFLVVGKNLRREDRISIKGTPHHDNCDFAYEAEEQKKLVRTWKTLDKKDSHQLRLVPDFNDDDEQQPHTSSFLSTRSKLPKLARILFTILREAKTDRLFSTERLNRNREIQAEHILRATLNYSIAPKQSLLDWTTTELSEFYELKRRLEAARSPEWKRPCGLFISTFDKIEDKILYPRRIDVKPIKIVGDLAVFGEKDVLRRAPYLVVGTVTFPTRESKEVSLYNVYAHSCYGWDRFMLVDSNLERETLRQLVECRDLLAEQNISMVIEKPMFDIGSAENDDAREVCRPDFVLRCRRGDTARCIVVVETMGYNDPVYRERKRRMRPLFENIKGGSPPHTLIEYDLFGKDMSAERFHTQFRKDVCAAVIKGCS